MSIRNVLVVGHGAALPLAPEDRNRLERAASRRGVTVDALALRLLHTIATDGMVDAVLDDGA